MYLNMLNKDTKVSQEMENKANFGFGYALMPSFLGIYPLIFIHRIFKLLDAADVCWSGVRRKLCRTVALQELSFAPQTYHQ